MWSLLVLLTACEARISGAPGDPDRVDAAAGDDATDPTIDASNDAAVTLGPWSPPAQVLQASTTLAEDDVTLSSNALEMIFAIDSANGKDLYYASRPSKMGAWTTPVKLPFNSATQSDETPRLSADDKTLFFASNRVSGNGLDIYAVTRAAPGATIWSTPQPVVSTPNPEKWYMPCGTRYFMVQSTTATGSDFDLVEGTIGSINPPAPITVLNSTANETGTFLTQDCLTIYFASGRQIPTAIYTSHRASLTAPWQAPTPVADFRRAGDTSAQEDPWLSADGRTFAFASDASGTKDIYLSTR